MNPSNQPPQNPQSRTTMDALSFNPQNMPSLSGSHFLPSMTNLTSAFGGGGGPESYSHFIPGDVTQAELSKKLKEKFAEMKEEVEKMEKNPEKFKAHQLPLARIKKIMKSDEDVRMISAEAPVIFAKACELFIVELTQRAWIHTEEGKRRTLQKNDVAQCIANTDLFDFLIDIIPREEYAKTAVMKKSSMLHAFSNQMPYPPGMPPMGNVGGMPGVGLNPQMTQMPQMPQMQQVNPGALAQNPAGNAGSNQNPAFMQGNMPMGNMPNMGNMQNMMFMQNLGMLGGRMPAPKEDK